MSTVTPPTPDDRPECVLPPKVKLLGEALAPVVSDLRRALHRRVRRAGKPLEIPDDVVRVTGELVRLVGGIQARYEALERWLDDGADASPLEVGRLVGRLEQVLDDFVDVWREIQSATDGPESGEERRLLAAIFRHYLAQLADWLDRLVAVIADPRDEVDRQGLPLVDGSTVTVSLSLTEPPEMARLMALSGKWSKTPIEVPQRADTPARPGLLAHLGAIAFGFGVAEALSGRDRER